MLFWYSCSINYQLFEHF